jgi:hypothetical protein
MKTWFQAFCFQMGQLVGRYAASEREYVEWALSVKEAIAAGVAREREA